MLWIGGYSALSPLKQLCGSDLLCWGCTNCLFKSSRVTDFSAASNHALLSKCNDYLIFLSFWDYRHDFCFFQCDENFLIYFTYSPALLEMHKLRVKKMFGCCTVDTDDQSLEASVKGAVLLLWRLQKVIAQSRLFALTLISTISKDRSFAIKKNCYEEHSRISYRKTAKKC